MNYEGEKIKQYLIGGLTEPEADKIDLQILSGELSGETLLIAENDLIEDYLENNLPPAELALFQKNFLASKARKRQIQQISLLKDHAEKSEQVENKTTEKNESGFFWKFVTLPSFMPLRVAFGIVIVSVFIGIFALIMLKDSPNGNFSPLEQEYAALNKNDLSDIGKFKDVSNISLVSGNFRSAGKSNNLSEENLTDKVLIRLALPNGVNSIENFRVELKNEGETVFTQIINRSYQNSNGEEIRFFVPSKILQKGDYQISVENPMANDSMLKYGFSID